MKYTPFPRFIIRTPSLPYNNLNSILINRNTLLKQWENTYIQDAIYIASPILYKELNKLYSKGLDVDVKDEKILLSFERYISRMSTRCTPFGLFAGCSVGNIGVSTKIELSESINRKTRLDMYFLCTLYDALLKKTEIKNKIKYFPNTSLYRIGKSFRYIECKYLNSRRRYYIEKVEYTTYLNKILKVASKGSTRNDLINAITNNEISIEVASTYIDEIIDSQILVGELHQFVTGDDFLIQLIHLIESINKNIVLLLPLKNIQTLLQKVDTFTNNIEIYDEIIKNIEEIRVPYEEKYLFQSDFVKDTNQASLGEDIIDEVKSTMTFLNKITTSGRNESINEFQEEFYNRYEEREIPLMEALDPELGIGYPAKRMNNDVSPLIENLHLPIQDTQYSLTISAFQTILLKKTIDCLSNNKQEIIFTDEDIKGLSQNWSDLPPTMYTKFEIIRSTPNDILLHLNFFSGCSAANLLARFAHADEKISELVYNITKKEEEILKEYVIAEIVHLPESRIGNILSRPHIRNHELVFMAYSDLPEEQLIHISDLVLCIKNNELRIRSKKLDKYIVPRLTTAHNYHNNTMPIYRFLSDMQHPIGRSVLFFNWGTELEKLFPYRPRVKYKNTILSPASWSIKKEDIEHLYSIKNEEELLIKAEEWRTKFLMPIYVLILDGDNKLFVDWRNHLSILSLFSIISKRSIITFSEFLFEEENAVIKENNKVFLNECIVCFYKD